MPGYFLHRLLKGAAQELRDSQQVLRVLCSLEDGLINLWDSLPEGIHVGDTPEGLFACCQDMRNGMSHSL